jgi:hypothetical protein
MNTCGGCEAAWQSLNYAHCAATGCHQTFSCVQYFDLHRRGGSCADPAHIVHEDDRPRLRLNDRGTWVGAEARPAYWENSKDQEETTGI